METQNFIVSLYTEMTPNPETLKFVLNKMLLAGQSVDFQENDNLESSPLASELFNFPYVRGVFIANDFVTIKKTPDIEWIEIKSEISEFIKQYVESEKVVLNELKTEANNDKNPDEPETEIEGKIKEVLEQYVKPAVEMDGGAIQFKSFDKGTVTLLLQGSCSGCPSSMVTLKSGIEGLLTRMVPEVKEVVAEEV
jgi:Fe-S cluster biogenesis protein NfuA